MPSLKRPAIYLDIYVSDLRIWFIYGNLRMRTLLTPNGSPAHILFRSKPPDPYLPCVTACFTTLVGAHEYVGRQVIHADPTQRPDGS